MRIIRSALTCLGVPFTTIPHTHDMPKKPETPQNRHIEIQLADNTFTDPPVPPNVCSKLDKTYDIN
jgi:hypothetical protein